MKEIYQKLEEICGKQNISNEELDLIVYNSDLASLPPVILKLYDIKPAEYVARPTSTSQISEIMKLANDKKVPITPRAGASAGLGGALAVSGGIILDLTSLDKIIGYNHETKYITVESGVSWKKLIKYLIKFNRKIGIHPSSSPSATIGGFISSGGYAGIGAPKFGPISEQIINLEVVLPTGEILTVKPPFSSTFVGAEGTLGIVTKICLKTYPIKGITALTFGFKNMRSAIQGILDLLRKGIRPYHLMLVDKYFLNLSQKLGIDIPKQNLMVFIALEGSIENLGLEKEKVLKILTNGELFNGGVASEEWDRRYNAELFIKRAGPSMILLEIGLSLANITEFVSQYNDLCEEKNVEVGFVGILGHGSTMLCMPFLLADERKGMDYLKLLSFSREIISLGLGVGGTIYGVGIHNAPYLKYIHSNETLNLFKDLKKILDPNNILNLGKIIESKVPDQLVPAPPKK
ncbi:MAG: FAD-binding oxidoreductase [Candidatus Hodarchaeota archaeon]